MPNMINPAVAPFHWVGRCRSMYVSGGLDLADIYFQFNWITACGKRPCDGSDQFISPARFLKLLQSDPIWYFHLRLRVYRHRGYNLSWQLLADSKKIEGRILSYSWIGDLRFPEFLRRVILLANEILLLSYILLVIYPKNEYFAYRVLADKAPTMTHDIGPLWTGTYLTCISGLRSYWLGSPDQGQITPHTPVQISSNKGAHWETSQVWHMRNRRASGVCSPRISNKLHLGHTQSMKGGPDFTVSMSMLYCLKDRGWIHQRQELISALARRPMPLWAHEMYFSVKNTTFWRHHKPSWVAIFCTQGLLPQEGCLKIV